MPMKHLFAVLAFLSMTACNSLTAPRSHLPAGTSYFGLWAAGETVSLLHSDKLMEDHVASLITQKDCSFSRYWNNKGGYCMTKEELLRAAMPDFKVQKVYCYATIAAPTCYAEPSPYPADRLIGVYDRPVYPVNEYF